MSLQTWKEEFYPIPADEVTKENAVQHSLTKWIGLREENLEKHNLKLRDGKVVETTARLLIASLKIAADSCALCIQTRKDTAKSYGTCWKHEAIDCDLCPLAATNGRSCDEPDCDFQIDEDEGRSLYGYFKIDHNPEPMIAALQRTLDNSLKT